MNINEFKIKLTGTANIPKELDNSSMWDLVIKNAEIRKKSYDPNDDGTENLTHTLKISELSEVQLVGQNEILAAKKKGSQSKVLRWAIQQIADEKGEDREEYYQKTMTKIIKMVENGEENILL